ncbi:RNA polymerase sigma factor [Sinomonas mesophila]|uniref:RNA polymerase sigma factor n=1 Tax=Sinomonas mesophila TaxID=1531955 RepID=UPI001FE87E8A|nr:RNA polymerase sigma factor [Sinomonas mesophila]
MWKERRRARAPEDADTAGELFTTAYRTLSPAILGYLRARGVDDPEAVTQDVFLAFYTRITPQPEAGNEAGADVVSTVDSDGRPEDPSAARPRLTGGLDGAKALLFTIAHSRAVDHHRRRGRTPSLVPHEAETDPRTAPATPEDLTMSQQDTLQLLGSLTEDHREVLLLRVVADLSIEQTADIMGRSTGAVKQLQRRALDALKTHALRTELSPA